MADLLNNDFIMEVILNEMHIPRRRKKDKIDKTATKFLNFSGAQETIPRKQFRQAGNRFLAY